MFLNLQISKHLTLAELTTSQTATRRGISNKAPMHVIENLKLVAEKILEPTRAHFGKPIRISSGYRSPELNRAVGGSKNSQHVTGQALDLQATNGITNAQIFNYIKDNLDFDQLVWDYGTFNEPAWVHVSFRSFERGKNRKQIFSIGVKKKF